jgi:hypothetical protein
MFARERKKIAKVRGRPVDERRERWMRAVITPSHLKIDVEAMRQRLPSDSVPLRDSVPRRFGVRAR